jgi:pimeloyl-ACP methyl ester carboxylesterase
MNIVEPKTDSEGKRRRLRKGLKAAGFTFASVLVVYASVIGIAAKLFLQPNRVAVQRPHGIHEVSVPSSYGQVPSWATANWRTSRVVFILVDGYGGSRQTWAPLMPELEKAGYGALALSMNGHDASPDSTVGFGPKEAHTIVDAVQWVRQQRPDHPKIVLLGLSMGGAACWLSTELDPSVDAVITDSAFADFPSAMTDWFNRVPGSGVVLAPAVWIAEAETGLDPSKIRPVDAARKWRGHPALVIRAGDDELMTPHHSNELSDASGAPLWVVPGAKHASCFNQDMPGYMRHLRMVVEKLNPFRKRALAG